MADVPRSYTPLCAQCGKWFLLAQRMERERDEWKFRAEELLREAVERDQAEAAGVLEQEAAVRRAIDHAIGEALNAGDGSYKP